MIFKDFIKPNQAKFVADEVNNANLKPYIEKLSEAVREASKEGKYEVKVRLDDISFSDAEIIKDELVEIGYDVNIVIQPNFNVVIVNWRNCLA